MSGSGALDFPEIPWLPDPFLRADGTRVTEPAEWPRQRAELARLVEEHVFGFGPPAEVRAEASAGTPRMLRLELRHDGRVARWAVPAWVPGRGQETAELPPYPAVLVIGRLATDQRAALLEAGYGVLELPVQELYSDDQRRVGAYPALFPYEPGRPGHDTGALRAWAWGVSRVVDALEQGAVPELDAHRTVVTSVSRFGKAALLAAALDPRVAVAVPVDAGQAGTAGFRYNTEGRRFIRCAVKLRRSGRRYKALIPQGSIGGLLLFNILFDNGQGAPPADPAK